MENHNYSDIVKKIINEMTTTTSSSAGGFYIAPLQPGIRPFKKTELNPFDIPVSNFKSPLVQYDSYDKKFDLRMDQIKKLEKQASKISDFIKKHPKSTSSDEDGNSINTTPRHMSYAPIREWVNLDDIVINEITTSTTSGMYNGPQELGLRKWKKNELGAFDIESETEINNTGKKKTLKNNLKRTVGVWEKGSDGTYNMDTYDVDTINEDLAVWFGTKKKSKGAKQPQGPWVNICRKKEGGGHPPCGRPEGESKGYPKCRAVSVARRMTDEQKRAACQQKRRAEKQDTQVGKGQKPVMTSYKPKKKRTQNESIDIIIRNILSNL